MYISCFQLYNYKSFYESPKLDLSEGFNLITGPNNVGKTALLEGLGLAFTGNPHRSFKTTGSPLNLTSAVDVSFTVSRNEFWQILRRNPVNQYSIQLPAVESELGTLLGIRDFTAKNVERVWNWFVSQESYRFDLRLERIANSDGQRWAVQQGRRSSLFSNPVSSDASSCTIDAYKRTLEISPGISSSGSKIHDLGVDLARFFASQVYSFKAERFASGECERREQAALEPNAGNLADVLEYLQRNPTRFREYMELVRKVLPQIKQVAVRQPKVGYVEVFIWTDDHALRRNELAFSLGECGTGVGQVLAILYTVFNSSDPITLIIDEPQSFLHAGAVRKLMDILQGHPKHQFIIATHSPTVIVAADARTITLVTQNGAESTLETLDVRKAENQTLYLNEVGASLSDVFGSDRVLWVEGKTEETCFHVILEKLTRHRLMGTSIVGVVNPGDLQGQHKRRVLEIYNRLTSSGALIPPAVAFIFDSENLTESEKEDLTRMSDGKIHFLNRRMYENYLLNASAIASVINSLDASRDTRVTDIEIETSLSNAAQEPKYFRSKSGEVDHDERDWVKEVDGASVLENLFAELSETRVHYEKVIHGLALTKWLIENDSSALQELATFLVSILDTPVSS
jgi:predicted ATPase